MHISLNFSQYVRDGCLTGGQQWDGDPSSRQWQLPPFLPDFFLPIRGRLVTRASRKCVRLRLALPRTSGVLADAAHHLPAQAEKHHLFFLLCPRLQQRGRELLYKHGDLQHLISEVNHLLTVHLSGKARSMYGHTDMCLDRCISICMHANNR